MKKDIAKKWIAALRSGDYKQGRSYLRSAADKFCCLGVLCNLHAQAHPEIAAKQTDPDDQYLYMGANFYLPRTVQKWAGMRTVEGDLGKWIHLPNGDVVIDLASMNDSGVCFKEIAKVIEENWKSL